MKNIFSKLAIFAIIVVCVSCESSSNYSKQLESERQKIEKWFAYHELKVENKFPQDSVFKVGQWYQFGVENIYFCINTLGTGAEVKNGDHLVVRYKQSTLDPNPIVYDYWNTLDRPYPEDIVKGSLVNSCMGWDDAFEYMRFSGTEAQVIVPSKLGFSEAMTVVEPFHFVLSMRISPK